MVCVCANCVSELLSHAIRHSPVVVNCAAAENKCRQWKKKTAKKKREVSPIKLIDRRPSPINHFAFRFTYWCDGGFSIIGQTRITARIRIHLKYTEREIGCERQWIARVCVVRAINECLYFPRSANLFIISIIYLHKPLKQMKVVCGEWITQRPITFKISNVMHSLARIPSPRAYATWDASCEYLIDTFNLAHICSSGCQLKNFIFG